MAIFKCKMCGGTLEISENQTTAVCEYCGTQQTLPKLDDEQKANLYDRANHFRRNNEFDKAMSIYENILNEDSSDAEAYWSLVLCRYGIEYVEDPTTKKRMPTVNRAQFTSIFDDDNYKSALENADMSQRAIYEAEAKAINDIQKGILAISQKEDPFDVFICYKETDNNGRRTPDSVLANDLYYQLTQEGFKVFFSRITLEDKLGTAYEPYIFAALNSAKVMVVLGTRPEYFKAVWVKNEWSRYLALVKQSGGKKVLIPAYRDMDPYDLPEEFSHLQAQDMGKLGFMQDLIRGIKKLTQATAPKAVVKETVVVNNGTNANVVPLLKRAFIFLEDGDWQAADEYCEKVLDVDPENADAYLAKMLSSMKVRMVSALKNCDAPFDNNPNYRKVMRFGDKKIQQELEGYNQFIRERNEEARLADIFRKACALMSGKTEEAYEKAAAEFDRISNYKDAAAKAKECREQAKVAHKDALYDAAMRAERENTEQSLRKAADQYQMLDGWKDSDDRFRSCLEKAEEHRLNAKYSTAAGQERMAAEAKDYETAVNHYRFAIRIYTEILQWKDSEKRIEICTQKISDAKLDWQYSAAYALESEGISRRMSYEECIESLEQAITIYKEIWQWKDSQNRVVECETAIDRLRAQKQEEAAAAERARILRAERIRRFKKKAKTVSIVTLLLLLVVAVGLFVAYMQAPESMYDYTLSEDGTATINALTAAKRAVKDGVLTIPDELEGHRVCKLASGALRSEEVHTVVIPQTVAWLMDNAFEGLPALREIVFEADAASCLKISGIDSLKKYQLRHQGECAWSEWGDDGGFDCTEGGNIAKNCKVCAAAETKVLAARPHTVVLAPEKAATCTTDGHTEKEYCSVCKKVFLGGETLPALGHTPVKDAAVAATCTSAGRTDGSHCAVCEETLVEQETLSELGHHYANRQCTRCGSRQPSEGLSYGRNGDGYTVTGMGTCQDTVIVIPEEYNGKSVTSIGVYAFEGCTSLTGITIPDSVTSIGFRAFHGCTSLTDVTILDGVTSIGQSAFQDCTSLTGITIPGSVTSIGDYAFWGCTSLPSISIPDSITSIGYQAFYDFSSLSMNTYDNALYLGNQNNPYLVLMEVKSTRDGRYTIYDGCKIIYGEAFQFCDLTDISIPDSVIEIGKEAFSYSNLTGITIPAGVTSIGVSAFDGCDALESIVVAASNPVYHSAGNCLIETAEKRLLAGCKNSTIPSDGTVTAIAESAFQGCDGLVSIIIPNGITRIEIFALSFCESLTSVTIPASVTNIDSYVFTHSSSLRSIIFKGTKAQWNAIEKSSTWGDNAGSYIIYCTDGNIPKG